MSDARDRQAAAPGRAIAGQESVSRGERYEGVGLGGRDPAAADIDQQMDTSARGQLLRFLEHRVFGPILRPASSQAAGATAISHDAAEIEQAAKAWAHYRDSAWSAEDIRRVFLAVVDPDSADGSTAAAWVRHVSPETRHEFIQLCDHLELGGRLPGDDVRGTDPGQFHAEVTRT